MSIETTRLRRIIKERDEQLRKKNLALDLLHWVWCTGGCKGGTNRYSQDSEITEEMVLLAERYALRLRTRWLNITKELE